MGTVHAKEPDVQQQGAMAKSPPADPEAEVILAEVPVKIQRIHIDGLQRTKDDIVAAQVSHLFKTENFEEMIRKVEEARVEMEQMGLFKKIKVFIDTSKGEDARPDGYEITYEVNELRRVTGGVSTLVGTNDGSLMFGMRLPNLFGRAEKLSGDYTYGTKASVGYAVNMHKPFVRNPNLSVNAGLFQFSGEYPWSGYKETCKGVSGEFTFPTGLGNHSLRWEGVWRELGCLSKTTAFAVREQAGHSLKSSLKHQWIREKRDDRVLPSSGYMVKISQELAGLGLGGDAHFLKHDLELQANKSLILDSVIQLSLAGGVMKSLKPGEDIRINDRFFLGGPLTLRGYNLKGVGPSEDGNALGADAYWLAGLHFYTPLPFRPGKGGFGELFRTHFWVNAGNLNNIDFNDAWKENVHKMADSLRWAYGAGIVLKMGGIARLEFNYCVPMRAQQGDSTSPGMQFGVGINFL